MPKDPKDLALFTFNNGANTATSASGWSIAKDIIINTLAGEDRIIGKTLLGDSAIYNDGSLFTRQGDDKIIGKSIQYDPGIVNGGNINTSIGSDIIKGFSQDNHGILNFGTITTGKGRDKIIGYSSSINDNKNLDGIQSSGRIITGTGNDKIFSRGEENGINNRSSESYIATGAGNDKIKGVGGMHGIINYGTISTGPGKDRVDATKGGFWGNGKTNLGIGNDLLKGFGPGFFDGGSGNDKVLFTQGTYTIIGNTIASEGLTMNVNNFEVIGGVRGGSFNYTDGTLTVDSVGIAIFTT
jgi:hypothetical protein